MGHLSRLPSSNEAEITRRAYWQPEDENGALTCMDAIRCCACRRVVLAQHVKYRDGHALCPDDEAAQAELQCGGRCSYNINRFKEEQSRRRRLDGRRCTSGIASGEAGEAD